MPAAEPFKPYLNIVHKYASVEHQSNFSSLGMGRSPIIFFSNFAQKFIKGKTTQKLNHFNCTSALNSSEKMLNSFWSVDVPDDCPQVSCRTISAQIFLHCIWDDEIE